MATHYVVGPPSIVAALVTVGFVVAGLYDASVSMGGVMVTLTPLEIPLLAGIAFLPAKWLLPAAVVGYLVPQVIHRRTRLAVYNAAIVLVGVLAATACYHALIGAAHPVSARAAGVGALAMLAESLSTGAVTLVRMSRVNPAQVKQTLRTMAKVTVVTSPLSMLLPVMAVLVISENRALTVLVAGTGALAIFAHRSQARLRFKYANLDGLYRLTLALGAENAVEAALPVLLSETRNLFNGGRAALIVPDGTGAICCELNGDQVGDKPLAVRPALMKEVHRSGTTVLANRGDASVKDALDELNMTNAIATTIDLDRDERGVLVVADRAGTVEFRPEDVDLFEAVAANGAVALRSERFLERLRAEARTREYEALHDSLTGLGNRALFTQHVECSLANRKDDTVVGVMLMDLDAFKEINDTLGHQTGDTILQAVADRLTTTMGERGMVSRLGGDEFAFVVPNVPDSADAVEIASELLEAVVGQIETAGLMLNIRASIGISVAERSDETLTGLLKRADVAMYTAKRAGGGVKLYDPATDRHTIRRLIVSTELRQALESRSIQVWYQPKADIRTGRILGAEALVRWNHPRHGPIPPDDFIAVAEQSGLINPLTWYVMDTAVKQVRAWNRAGLSLGVAVNLSPRTLIEADLLQRIHATLDSHLVDPSRLTLELTESSFVSDSQASINTLTALTESGIHLALDDFGTGYSSLSRLKNTPFTELKIDRSFVAQMAADPGDRAIVAATIELAHHLGLTTVAEGVEELDTWELLHKLGCEQAQGFHLAQAMPTELFDRWLGNYLMKREKASKSKLRDPGKGPAPREL